MKLWLNQITNNISLQSYRISSNKRRASNKRHTFGYAHRNKRLPSNKRRTSKYDTDQNSYYILLETKPKFIWTQYANNKTMKILLIFRYFHYIWFIDSEKLCFILILKEKMTSFDN